MNSDSEQIRMLYEFAMSIGGSLDLGTMLRQSMTTVVRKLNCCAGGVHLRAPGAPAFSQAFILPRHAERMGEYQEALSRITALAAARGGDDYERELPLVGGGGQGRTFHVAALPQTGVMVLIKSGKPLDKLLFKSMGPLFLKMAFAVKACQQNEELRAHQSNLEAMVQSKSWQLVLQNKLLQSENEERKQAQEGTRLSEARLRAVVDNLPFDLFGVDADGKYFLQNPVSLSQWGDLRGKRPEQVLVDDRNREAWLENIRRAMAGEIVRGEVEFDGGGARRHFLNIVAPIRHEGAVRGILGFNIDVTERKQLEQELLKSQKLESVGVLAGGIAHDFNNILTGVLGNISLALAAEPGDPVRERLTEAERAVMAARGLTQQLLTFAKGGAPVKKAAHIGHLLREQTTFACRGSNVTCAADVDEGLWAAAVDEGQISQVVHNLVLNAVQAMPGGGTVQVRAENLECGAREDPVLGRGRYLRIAVRDTGCGITAGNLTRMFDPYFTTKEGGTGLGLAVTHSIVKQHGGHIRVESEPGRGATFLVYLPAVGVPPAAAAPGASAATGGGVRTGSGRVLVMDDETLVRDIATKMLVLLGYEAETVEDGAAALAACERAQEQGRPFDVVILDLTVPGGMGGREAVRTLLEREPEARVIVSSGYSNDPVMANYAEHGFCGVIAKPYRLSDFGAEIRRVLALAPSPAR